AEAISPDGSELFVSGFSVGSGGNSDDFATVAYDTSTGAVRWIRGYNGPGGSNDMINAMAVSPDGTKVFVTGFSTGESGSDDIATAAYDAASGRLLWAFRGR